MQKNNDKQPQGLTALIGEPTPSKRAGLLYSLAAFAFFGVALLFSMLPTGEETPDWYLYCSFLAAPLAFLIVVFWYFSSNKFSVKGFLKGQRCSAKYYLVAILMQFGLLSLGELNGLFLKLLGKLGYVDSGISLPSTAGFGLVGVLLTVAVLPAILEELFFRGILQSELKGFSVGAQVLLCGALFALYHQNPAQTLYQFACGVAFALVAVKSGSFLPTVLSHFLNNAAVIVLYALGIESYPLAVYIPLIIVEGLCLIGVILYLLLWDKGEQKTEEKGSYKQLFACGSVGLAVFGLSWLATLLAGL